MSAILLPNIHINSLVSYAKNQLDGRPLKVGNIYYNLAATEDFATVAVLLFLENLRSVQYRYQNHPDTPTDILTPRVVKTSHLGPADIVNAIDCYHYQSSEHPDYKQSLAYAIAEKIRHIAIDTLLRQQNCHNTWIISE